MDTFIQIRSLSKRITEENEIHVRTEDQFVQGLIGFTNSGNYCYINSVIQALSNCPPFAYILINSYIPKDHSTATSFSLSTIFREIWVSSRQSRTITSRPVTQALRHPTFNGLTQQDAQEFMRHILNKIHEEMREEVPDYFRRLQDDNRSIRSEISCDVTESYDDALHADRVVTEEPQHDVNSIFSNLPTPTKIDCLPYRTPLDTPDIETGRVRNKLKKHSLNPTSHTNPPPTILPSDVFIVDVQSSSARIITNTLEAPNKHSNNIPLTDTDTCRLSIYRTPSNSTSNSSTADAHLQHTSSLHSIPSDNGSLQRRNRSATPNTSRREIFPEPHRPVYRSLVTDLFEGQLKSTVKCLTCKKVSITTERFQDLSLPIPNKKELSETKTRLHGRRGSGSENSVCNIFSYLKSLITSPETSLEDCLHVFFRKDDLNGNNRYFCESCRKLRNSIKFSRIHKLPEILCIHFKRFRHDGYWASSKISRYISFPLNSLDLTPYMVKGTRTPGPYNLLSAVCHIGGVGGGHYVTYTHNDISKHWYLFDDDIVRRVTTEQVRSLQSYMLIYRLNSDITDREHIPRSISPSSHQETYYISKHWLCLYDRCMYPGPIAQFDFVCVHGKVKPNKESNVLRLVRSVTRDTWEQLHDKFGGGPPITELSICQTCQEDLIALNERRASEKKSVNHIQDSCCKQADSKRDYYAINQDWLKEWQIFINSQDLCSLPPGPVDNRPILTPILRDDTHFRYSELILTSIIICFIRNMIVYI
ncbi:Ubiquitin carboxyl-terminal hydrolase 33 isoform X2 [Oopsacas minuta]|uniref:ubiquitinyl hydrolase 1 n=1 Tax=Oopsacas minuta TaxID=111878 RepID=A0AAV7K011_9METZ|nr:Ubiquitin carboxyl-terminal hydrolase 33 isoform X2 [Oopsacas minuta]